MKFCTRSLTESEPVMTIFGRIGDPFGIWRSRSSFWFHETVYQFRVQSTLAKNLPIGDATIRRKKTTQLLNWLADLFLLSSDFVLFRIYTIVYSV